MQDSQNFEMTERFALEEEVREIEWQEQYASRLGEVVWEMNMLLGKQTWESRWKLHDMLSDEKFFKHYRQVDTVAIMYVVMKIYEHECEAQIYPTILECGHTVEELLQYIGQLKFILYRVDFGIDDESEQELVEYLKKYSTSTVTIEAMLTTTAMRPMRLALKLEQIFEKNYMYKALFSIRTFISQRWSGNHRILMSLSTMYDDTGHEEYARECLGDIPELLLIMYSKDQTFFQIQELMWRILYKDMTAVDALTELLQRHKTTAEDWKDLLQEQKLKSEEYYLILVESLLEKEMIDLAMETVRVGVKMIPQNEVLGNILLKIEKWMGNMYE